MSFCGWAVLEKALCKICSLQISFSLAACLLFWLWKGTIPFLALGWGKSFCMQKPLFPVGGFVWCCHLSGSWDCSGVEIRLLLISPFLFFVSHKILCTLSNTCFLKTNLFLLPSCTAFLADLMYETGMTICSPLQGFWTPQKSWSFPAWVAVSANFCAF